MFYISIMYFNFHSWPQTETEPHRTQFKRSNWVKLSSTIGDEGQTSLSQFVWEKLIHFLFFHPIALLPHRGVTLVQDNTNNIHVLLTLNSKVCAGSPGSFSSTWVLTADTLREAHAEHLSPTPPARKRVNKLILLHLISARPPIHHSQTWISLMDNKVLRSHAAARIRIRFSNYSRLFSCNLTETDRSPRWGSETLVLMKSTICLGSSVSMAACARLQVASPRGLINEQPVKRPGFARCKKKSSWMSGFLVKY